MPHFQLCASGARSDVWIEWDKSKSVTSDNLPKQFNARYYPDFAADESQSAARPSIHLTHRVFTYLLDVKERSRAPASRCISHGSRERDKPHTYNT